MSNLSDRQPGQPGDLAIGGGYLGEIVDLPGGRVGLALFNEHGWERRIVYVPAEDVKVVKLAQDRPTAPQQRDQEFGQMAEAHAREQVRTVGERGW